MSVWCRNFTLTASVRKDGPHTAPLQLHFFVQSLSFGSPTTFSILNFINDQWDRVGRLLRRRTCLSPCTREFIPRSFDEENRTSDSDFHTRTISFHLRLPPRYRRCKVTCRGALPVTGKLTPQKKRQDLEDPCRCIDFGMCTLLDDVVTELIVTRDGASPNSPFQRAPQTNREYGPIAGGLSIHVQE